MISGSKPGRGKALPSARSDFESSTQSMEVHPEHFFMSFGIRKRKIFYRVKYTEEEEKWVREVGEGLWREYGIEVGEKQTLLRYYYSSNLKMEACLQKLKVYHDWFHNSDIQTLSREGREVMGQGFVYSYAKNTSGRPFSVMNIGDMDAGKHRLNVFYQVLNHVNNQVIAEGFTPGSVETYDYILDLNEKFLSLPISSLKDYVGTIGDVYSMRMENMYIVNCTTLAKWLYTGVEKVLSEETSRKIKLFTKDEIDSGKLREFIDPSVLEVKYGGEHPDIDHLEMARREKALRREVEAERNHLGVSQETEYFSVDENNQMFQKGGDICCGTNECSIY